MALTKMDRLLRKHARMSYISRVAAKRSAKERKAVLIQVVRGKQWATVTGSDAVVSGAMKRLKEANYYLGQKMPIIIADYRKK